MRRVFGLETEYGFFCRVNGNRLPSRENVIRYVFEQAVPGARNGNVFLENGGRFYLDSGFHPEYATPETDQVGDLVAHDKAGERIVADLLLRARRLLREEGLTGSVLAFKNNTDTVGNSFGCHENYLARRDIALECLAAGLIPFLVTRQVFAGAGKVLQTIRGSQFCLSQRAQHITQEVSGGTTSSRAIINTRDETLADAHRYRRLHLILGDSNMSEVATYLKVGTTALVIDMIEDGWLNGDYALHGSVSALRTISRDPTLRATVKLKDGRLLTALEIQGVYLDRAIQYAQSSGCDPERRIRRDCHAPPRRAVQRGDQGGSGRGEPKRVGAHDGGRRVVGGGAAQRGREVRHRGAQRDQRGRAPGDERGERVEHLRRQTAPGGELGPEAR